MFSLYAIHFKKQLYILKVREVLCYTIQLGFSFKYIYYQNKLNTMKTPSYSDSQGFDFSL